VNLKEKEVEKKEQEEEEEEEEEETLTTTTTTTELPPVKLEGEQKFVFTPQTEGDISLLKKIFEAVKAELGNTKLILGKEVQIPISAKIGAALLAFGGTGLLTGATIGGVAATGVAGSTALKGATAVSGVDTIMVWMASDNVLTGTAFTLRKLREAVKSGAISQSSALAEARLVQTWITYATEFVDNSIELNPILLPFARILKVNAAKAQKDYDLEVKLIKKTFPKK